MSDLSLAANRMPGFQPIAWNTLFQGDANAPTVPQAGAASVGDGDRDAATSYAEGHAAGRTEGRIEADAEYRGLLAKQSQIDDALLRLKADEIARLTRFIRESVAALSEQMVVLRASDEELLDVRIAECVALLPNDDGPRSLHAHPDDLPLLRDRGPTRTELIGDESLERGTLRIEAGACGIEDGPAVWRAAIAAAIEGC